MRMIPADREPTPPGEILSEEFMKPLGLTQAALESAPPRHLRRPDSVASVKMER